MTQAYPLAWPIGWPRTPADAREYGRFSHGAALRYSDRMTVAVARDRLMDELRKMHVVEFILSTDLKTRNDGLPRSGQTAPSDPGAAVYFRLGERDQVIPCDKYTRVEQNIAAIAATIAALRTLDRHGSGIMERAFTGFQALPNPHAPLHGTGASSIAPWHEVLGVAPDASDVDVHHAYLRARSEAHPDKPSGSAAAFERVTKAWQYFKNERGEQ